MEEEVRRRLAARHARAAEDVRREPVEQAGVRQRMGEPLRTAAGRDADRAGERVDDRGDTFDRTQLELERACEPFMDQVGESRRQRASVPGFEVGSSEERSGGEEWVRECRARWAPW